MEKLEIDVSPKRLNTQLYHGMKEFCNKSLYNEHIKGKKCYFCGTLLSEPEVHHLDGDTSNLSAENIVPVCFLCHRCTHIDHLKYFNFNYMYSDLQQEVINKIINQCMLLSIVKENLPNKNDGSVARTNNESLVHEMISTIYNEMMACASDSAFFKIIKESIHINFLSKIIDDYITHFISQVKEILYNSGNIVFTETLKGDIIRLMQKKDKSISTNIGETIQYDNLNDALYRPDENMSNDIPGANQITNKDIVESLSNAIISVFYMSLDSLKMDLISDKFNDLISIGNSNFSNSLPGIDLDDAESEINSQITTKDASANDVFNKKPIVVEKLPHVIKIIVSNLFGLLENAHVSVDIVNANMSGNFFVNPEPDPEHQSFANSSIALYKKIVYCIDSYPNTDREYSLIILNIKRFLIDCNVGESSKIDHSEKFSKAGIRKWIKQLKYDYKTLEVNCSNINNVIKRAYDEIPMLQMGAIAINPSFLTEGNFDQINAYIEKISNCLQEIKNDSVGVDGNVESNKELSNTCKDILNELISHLDKILIEPPSIGTLNDTIGSDFSFLTKSSVLLSRLYQRIFFSVDEHGNYSKEASLYALSDLRIFTKEEYNYFVKTVSEEILKNFSQYELMNILDDRFLQEEIEYLQNTIKSKIKIYYMLDKEISNYSQKNREVFERYQDDLLASNIGELAKLLANSIKEPLQAIQSAWLANRHQSPS